MDVSQKTFRMYECIHWYIHPQIDPQNWWKIDVKKHCYVSGIDVLRSEKTSLIQAHFERFWSFLGVDTDKGRCYLASWWRGSYRNFSAFRVFFAAYRLTNVVRGFFLDYTRNILAPGSFAKGRALPKSNQIKSNHNQSNQIIKAWDISVWLREDLASFFFYP